MDKIIRILCIDDEINVLRALKRIFLDEDYVMFTATTTELAWEIMETASPIHVIICDYRMPGEDGIEFLKKVCSTWPDPIRLILSGYVDTPVLADSKQNDVIHRFIPKPWNDHELREWVQEAIGLYFSRPRHGRIG